MWLNLAYKSRLTSALHRNVHSETHEQREYEQHVLNQNFADVNPQEELASDQASVSSETSSKKSKSGVSGFFKNYVKPIYDDARTDFSIVKAALSVENNITKDLRDPQRFPEVAHVAEVRRGADLSTSEKAFIYDRKIHTRDAFARYIGLDPSRVHPEDVPTVAFGGSGGGFRAMIACMGYCEELKQAGMWDLLTYVSGVSGSCWALASYYTFGEANMTKVIDHCKKRLSPYHPLSPDAVRTLLKQKPYETLGPIMAKRHSGLHTVAMDLYSVFTTGYVFMVDDPSTQPGMIPQTPQKEVAGYHSQWYKWSNALKYLNGGAEPMPILTAIRHERPWKDWADPEHAFKEDDPTKKEHAEASDAWFQWFELTPLEVGCDELACWVPTWGFGRPFEGGRSTMQLPEQSLALVLGLCTAAPAGPMTSYLATIKRALPTGIIGDSVNSISHGISKMWGKQGKEVFQQHHPLHASNEHNYMYHLTPVAPGQGRPPGIENSPRLHLIDSGMDNNCPTYVLLHPNREVDVILNMDASSDVQKDTFQERVDQIGSRRGLKFTKRHDIKPDPDKKNPDRFQGLYAQIYDGILIERPPTVTDSYGHAVTNPPAPVCHQECTMVYMPLLPNERAVPDFDPSTAKFSGSYNLVWTAEQVDMLVKVCKQNFHDGHEAIQTALMDAYLRKKAKREGTWDPKTYQPGSRPLDLGYQGQAHAQQEAHSAQVQQQYEAQQPIQTSTYYAQQVAFEQHSGTEPKPEQQQPPYNPQTSFPPPPPGPPPAQQQQSPYPSQASFPPPPPGPPPAQQQETSYQPYSEYQPQQDEAAHQPHSDYQAHQNQMSYSSQTEFPPPPKQ
ncbi:FabD/lysophospholipase-like protein [Rhizodiscina lignyota]|uniref:Lysophospholipase n=1 Tax=Rhizodiscina lignyota TaxID=1504668 RepID=A0A9P4IGU0_9PEZI|nr:FabD/lysophospholipase-like protein [Rhizodiscina lignyota]